MTKTKKSWPASEANRVADINPAMLPVVKRAAVEGSSVNRVPESITKPSPF
ncbi:MAG: hypothetical protein ABF379_15700 [Akkermansiaceae bacterium]